MGDPTISSATFRLLAPEILLVATAAVVYVGGAFVRQRGLWQAVALIGWGLAACTLAVQGTPQGTLAQPSLVEGPLLCDAFGHLTRWLGLSLGLLFTLGAGRVGDDRLASEYIGSLLLAIAGTMLLGVAGDIVLLFLSLELISIPSYIVLYLGRDHRRSLEASVK